MAVIMETLINSLIINASFSSKTNIDNNHYNTVSMGNDVYVFEVVSFNSGKLDSFSDQERDSGKIALAEQLGSNELAMFAKELRESAEVVINSNLFSDAYDL